MNDGKSIDETEALPLVNNASKTTLAPEGRQGLDQRRRRLLRGAAGIAPVVLTLRSGALAASSCTGVRLRTNTDVNAQFTDTSGTVVAGDTCVIVSDELLCPPNKIRAGASGGYTTVTATIPTVPASPAWQCKNATGIDFVSKTNVAILSSTSASSLNIV